MVGDPDRGHLSFTPLVQSSDPLPVLKVIGLGRDGMVTSGPLPREVHAFDEFFVLVTEAQHGHRLQLLIQDRRMKARGRVSR